MRSYGYIESKLTGNEQHADEFVTLFEIPDKYELKNLPPVRDQGSINKCVSVSLTDIIGWKVKSNGNNFYLDDQIFFDNRDDKCIDGMSPKEAFNLLINKHITQYDYSIYAMIGSEEVLKRSIIQFGPVMVCLPVRSYSDEFWKGSDHIGGHAVLFTGYNRFGFTLRNSWGTSYGRYGYIDFPYSDFNTISEAWTLIK